ncbi:hypothetical protein HU200_004524 [Digitaria exilis]|uniref:Uncharacterized protein n=1 Tax=Digitaria exilis TaxID=1010633 RepID=A0A835KTF7_9POAL|nr:hypothetical protein HU200_004524 [Digitaria exilis]
MTTIATSKIGCRWRGVRCSNKTGHVLELDLRNVLILEDDEYGYPLVNGLVGEISNSLLSLEHLQHLDLSMNNLEGSTGRVPEFFGLLGESEVSESLRAYCSLVLCHLSLATCQSCSILTFQLWEIANQSLTHLNFTGLEVLDLYNNDFEHSIESCWFWNIRNLKYLNLAGCSLYGRFPPR